MSAVLEKDGETCVQAVKENKIMRIPVELGVESDVEIQIIPKDGAELDDTVPVVLTPDESYQDGMEVLSVAQ